MTYTRDPIRLHLAGRVFAPPVLATLTLLLLALPDAAWAGDNIFGTDSPLTKFVDFTTGPFAYLVVIVAMVATVGVLALGGEFSGFSRRMPIVVVAGGIVILAQTVLGNLFGAGRAATLPPDMAIQLEERMSGDWSAPGTEPPSRNMSPMNDQQVGAPR